MKKVLRIVVLAAVASVASADLSYFQFKGGQLFDNGGSVIVGTTITDGAKIQLVDLTPFVSGGKINILDIPAAYFTGNIATAPLVPFGGTYQTGTISERPSSVIGETAYLLFDLNGGAIEVGDYIGLSGGTVIADMAAVGDPAPANPQVMSPGNITANIEVIPEPATLGLMGIAGLGLFLARKKARS